MSEKLEQELQQERKEKEPEISYHFFYSAHYTAQDFKNLEKAFDKADIYVPERYKWTPEGKHILEQVSQGEITLEEVAKKYDIERSSSHYREFEIIYNSYKPIIMVDIPETDKGHIEMREEAESRYEQALDLFIQGRFQDALGKLRSSVLKTARLELVREKKIRRNLEKQIKVFLKQNPKYAEKEELSVLIRIGGFHIRLYDKLKKKGAKVSQEFSHPSPVFSSADEAIKTMISKREVDDELLGRILIEEYVYPWLASMTDDTEKSVRILRKISSQLTLENIEQISKNIHETSQEPRTPSFPGFPIEDVVYEIEELGIKVPNSEQEMDELLKQSSTRTSYGNPKS